jgi:mannose/fructose-specific phosphotransferase system component IIA
MPLLNGNNAVLLAGLNLAILVELLSEQCADSHWQLV